MMNAQAPLPAVPTSSEFVLRGENARLQQEIAAKEAIIAERDEQVSKSLGKISICRETSAALTQILGDAVRGKANRFESMIGELDDEVVRKENYNWLSDDWGNTTDPTNNNDKEEPSAYTSETRELSPAVQEDAEETNQDRKDGPALSPHPNALVSQEPASFSLATETEPTLRASHSGEIFLWPRPMRCALMVESNDGSRGPIRDPFEPMNGWQFYLDVDAGRHGRPSVGLYFSINNGKKNARVSRSRHHRTDFAISWRTGVVIDQPPMIQNCEARIVSVFPQSGMPLLAMKTDKNSDVHQQYSTKLVALTFRSNGMEKPELSATTKKPWRGLHTDIQQCLDTLFFQDEPVWMTIWFCIDSTPDLAMSTWISALQRAVEQC